MPRKMTITEFRELGFIQELNRRMLHPCGLAISTYVADDGNEYLDGVWDYRDEGVGPFYSSEELSRDAARGVDKLLKTKARERLLALDYSVQPIPRQYPDYRDEDDVL